MPTPVREGAHPIDAFAPDLGCEHRTKTIPPIPNPLVANLDSSLMKEVLHIAERQRKSDVHHHGEADDLG
jgi:hypothetical protein